jgi:hypothetical protein
VIELASIMARLYGTNIRVEKRRDKRRRMLYYQVHRDSSHWLDLSLFLHLSHSREER